jgi:TetR/AcrR family transcriptional repressor of lmrAB and yxaGH operons
LTTTSKLLQRQGYHGTGLNQIVAEADAPKGSLYFHFPGGKEQLVAEAIGETANYLDRALAAHDTGSAASSLDGYLTTIIDRMERSGFQDGCPIATVALDVGASSELIASACSAAFDRVAGHVAAWFERDGVDPETARASAGFVYAALQGAMVFAKARRSVQPLEELRAALPSVLPRASVSS